jgi:hypothetical protein
MIVWQGWGMLGALIPIVLYLGDRFLFDTVYGRGYSDSHSWVASVSLILGGLIVGVIGMKFKNAPGRELVDPNTGKRVVLRRKHTIFYIPLEIFGGILIAVGIGKFFIR